LIDVENNDYQLNESDRSLIVDKIDRIIGTNPDYCLFFDSSQSFVARLSQALIPSQWLESVIDCLYRSEMLLTYFHSFSNQIGLIYKENKILLELHSSSDPEAIVFYSLDDGQDQLIDYEEMFNGLYNEFTQLMETMYVKGTVVCDTKFAVRWNLEVIEARHLRLSEEQILAMPNIDGEPVYKESDAWVANVMRIDYDGIKKRKKGREGKMEEKVLCQALWGDNRVGNLNVFLERKLMGIDEVMVFPFNAYENNEIQKHFIAKRLLDVGAAIPQIYNNNVVFICNNYQEYSLYMDAIYVSKHEAYGNVYVRILYNIDHVEIYNKYFEEEDGLSVAYYYNLDGSVTYSLATEVDMVKSIDETFNSIQLKHIF
jgi:hypothetical protein